MHKLFQNYFGAFSLSLILLTVFLLYTRLFNFGSIPKTLYWDEVAIMVDAKSIAKTGYDHNGEYFLQPLFFSYGDYKLPIYIYLTAFVNLFSDTNIAVRIPNLFFGILSCFLIAYLATKIIKNDEPKKLFLITLLFATLTPAIFFFSRVGFESFASQFFLTLAITVLFINKNTKPWQYFTAVLIGLIASYTYYSTRFVFPPLFITVFLLKEKIDLNFFKKFRFVFLIFYLVIFVLGLNLFKLSAHYEKSQLVRLSTESVLDMSKAVEWSNANRAKLDNSLISKVIFHRYHYIFRELATNYADHLNINFLYLNGDSNLRHGTGKHGVLLLSFLPFSIYGLFLLAQKHRSLLLIFIVWIIFGFLPASVPQTTPHLLRSLNILTPLIIITSFGFYSFWKNFDYIKYIFLFIFVFEFITYLHFYFNVYPTISASYWQQDYYDVTKKALRLKSPDNIIKIHQLDSRLYLWFLLYGNYQPEEYAQLKNNLDKEGFEFVNGLDDDIVIIERNNLD